MYLPWVIGFHSFNPFDAGLKDESAKILKNIYNKLFHLNRSYKFD